MTRPRPRAAALSGNLALGVVDDPTLTAEVAAAIAGRLARCGVNMNPAPVADVNTNPDNPVIGVRSFGADPELVADTWPRSSRGRSAKASRRVRSTFRGTATPPSTPRQGPCPSSAAIWRRRSSFRAAIAAAWRRMTAHLAQPKLDEAPPRSAPGS